MSSWQLGEQQQARQDYDRAVQWTEKAKPWEMDVEQLRHIRKETEELLKITENTTTK